ncbi:MAG: TorF family putative porin [Porticoccaceae bacterium]|nr:TorF family putative porin [Porticoccaceae bacterium]
MAIATKNLALGALIVLSPLALSPVAATAAEVSGNVTLASEYRFRGISQSDTDPAIQGGFDVAFDSGFYAGVWASNVDFGTDADLEMDFYAGFSGAINEAVSYDLGYIYYDYPGTDGVDFTLNGNEKEDYEELYASLSFGDATVGIAYSDDYWLSSGEFYYFYGDYSFALPEGFGLDLHYGYNSFDVASGDSNAKDAETAFLSDDTDSYSDYSVALTKTVVGLDLALAWVDTDLDKEEIFDSNWADSAVVFSVSKSL